MIGGLLIKITRDHLLKMSACVALQWRLLDGFYGYFRLWGGLDAHGVGFGLGTMLC